MHSAEQPPPDVQAFDFPSFLVIRPCSDEAEAWLRDNLVGDNAWLPDPGNKYGKLMVEGRYGPALLRGAMDADLTVYFDGDYCDG